MSRIGLFFGSFDPPHIGHVDLVTSALNAKVVDRVMVIPAWQNVWKEKSSSFWSRFRMCEHAFKHTAIVNPVEERLSSQLDGKVYTYDVVRYIKQQYAAHESNKVIELVMLTSLETLKGIPKWEKGELLLKEIPIVVEGIDFHAHNIPVHSTQIRDLIKQGKYAQPFIQDSVYEVIKTNKLYI